MRTSSVSVCLLAGLAACDAAAQRPSGRFESVAVVELQPPSGMPEGMRTAAPDEAYLATAIEKIALPDTILRAVRDARLATLPDFEGRPEDEIIREIRAGLVVRQLAQSWLVEVGVRGANPKILDDEANAVARAFVANETLAVQSVVETRRAEMDQRVVASDARIQLLSLDKRTALQGASFTESTADAEMEARRKRHARFTERQDLVSLELIALEARLRAGGPAAEDRKALVAQQTLLTTEQQALRKRIEVALQDIVDAAAIVTKLDGLNAEVARHVDNKTAALRELELMAQTQRVPPRPAWFVAEATEPTQPR